MARHFAPFAERNVLPFSSPPLWGGREGVLLLFKKSPQILSRTFNKNKPYLTPKRFDNLLKKDLPWNLLSIQPFPKTLVLLLFILILKASLLLSIVIKIIGRFLLNRLQPLEQSIP